MNQKKLEQKWQQRVLEREHAVQSRKPKAERKLKQVVDLRTDIEQLSRKTTVKLHPEYAETVSILNWEHLADLLCKSLWGTFDYQMKCHRRVRSILMRFELENHDYDLPD